ncbi:hypothetical protein GCM10007073_01990 [Micrococcus flavus]|nr:hypothetical protein GCM10007073_01990 [Micrococcus flavus]
MTRSAVSRRHGPAAGTTSGRTPGRGVRPDVGAAGASEPGPGRRPAAQWNESPQAQEPTALGLSIVKPCFEMVSSKSMVAPIR